MKTRNGFVSNSSSSSFVLIGRELKTSELTEEPFKEKDIQAVGGWLEEGRLVMEMNWDMYQFIKEHKEFKEIDGFDCLTFYESIVDISEEGVINRDDLPEGNLNIISGEYDHYSPQDVKDLEEYLEHYNE